MKELEKLLESGDFEIHGENGEVFKGSDLKKEGIEVYLKKTNKRLEEALRLKGDHKIYFCNLKEDIVGGIENAAEIADLSECIRPRLDGDWIIPDYTPDWLYDIIDLYGGVELMESIFEFKSKETISELAEICDIITGVGNEEINEKQIKRLMFLISCEALLDQESIGDRFCFENEDGSNFLPDFLNWLENKNPELYEKYGGYGIDVAQAFWLEDKGEGEYDIFKECVIYVYEHPKALRGVIKELEDKDLDRYSNWTYVDIETNGLITSFIDFKKELKELKSYDN